jgi:hypothetical protein
MSVSDLQAPVSNVRFGSIADTDCQVESELLQMSQK